MKLPLLTVSAVVTAISYQASGSTIRTQEYKCPLDGEIFESTVAMSGTSFGRRFDLKKLGPIYQPWPKAVCPTSGFVIYKSEFSEAEIATLSPMIWSNHYQMLREQHTPHFLAAIMAKRLGNKGWGLVWLYIQATWEAEGNMGKDDLPAYLQKLEDELSLYLPDLSHGTDEWLTAKLLLANTLRRQRRFTPAIAHARALRDFYRHDERQHIIAMLDRFITIAEAEDSRPRGINERSDEYLLQD